MLIVTHLLMTTYWGRRLERHLSMSVETDQNNLSDVNEPSNENPETLLRCKYLNKYRSSFHIYVPLTSIVQVVCATLGIYRERHGPLPGPRPRKPSWSPALRCRVWSGLVREKPLKPPTDGARPKPMQGAQPPPFLGGIMRTRHARLVGSALGIPCLPTHCARDRLHIGRRLGW